MKDNFSQRADQYARYRPTYPDELFDYLKGLRSERLIAWDCGTGNGQVAMKLAEQYTQVYATDISKEQLKQAVRKSNIHYSVQPAERTNFPQDYFDLIVVAQAIHWFDFGRFYDEVKRIAKADAFLVVIGYGLLSINKEVGGVIQRFYSDIIGPYWDPERKYVDNHYRTIPFPFEEVEVPQFQISYSWALSQLIGYLNTWSAVRHYIKERNDNPITLVRDELEAAWGRKDALEVTFPLFLKVGKINTSPLFRTF